MIESLAYIGFTSPASEEWRTFGPELLAMELAPDGEDGAVRLRLDDAAHRITVHPGDRDDLAHLGWAVDGEAGLAAAVAALTTAGFEIHHGDADLATDRGVAGVAWFVDPFGFRHELAWGQLRTGGFRPGRPMSGFVTGAGGLGHVVLFVPDLTRAETFYTDVLGFRLSDEVVLGATTLRFLHCNERHHTVALAAVPGMRGLHHLMVEVAVVDDVDVAYERCRVHDVPVVMELGRHTNDHMTSFYVRTPSGFEIEYGHGGVLVDDEAWTVATYDSTSEWGHEPGPVPLRPGVLHPVAAP